jgi:peroxiredoxin Q/BCP
MLQQGALAPQFTLPDENGKEHSLSEYLGKKVVLYFYPKDNTPGCTRQACAFAELFPQFQNCNAVILGISKDTVASHFNFKTKFNLPFTLLSDVNLEAINAYGVWQEKVNYGKKSMGVVRSAFLIDEAGKIVRALINVKADENPAQMLSLCQTK